MSKRKITVGVVAIILLIAASVWAFWSRSDPQLEKVKQLRAEAFKEGATPEQRQQNFAILRQEMDKLTPEQREALRQQRGQGGFERRLDQQAKEYFALPTQQERVAYLDKQIKEMEKRRKEWESRRAQAQPNAAGGGQLANAAGGGLPGPGTGRQGARPAPGSDASLMRRDARRDNSTAEQRAMRSNYMADIRARRIQLGLPPSPFPGGRGPR